MSKIIYAAALAVAIALLVALPAGGQEDPATALTPASTPVSIPTPEPTPRPVVVTVSQYRNIAQAVYRHHQVDGDFHARPEVTAHMKRRLIRMKSHARTKRALYRMRKITETQRQHWRWFRKIDRITVYGKWSIPWSVVACESHGDWYAHNPSGASGPYQMMPMWRAPYPAVTIYQKAVNHILAARLWAGGTGAHNWSCA